MEPQPTNRRPMFNKHEIECGMLSFICYVGSFCCFCGHVVPRKFDWKVNVGFTIYSLPVFFTVYISLQKFGYIGLELFNITPEVGRACNLVGPILAILAIPLLEGEYANLALFATLLGTISFAGLLMFIAPITTDFGLLNVLCAASIKLSWENEYAEILVWARTGTGCTAILIIRYLVDRAVRMRIAREVELRV